MHLFISCGETSGDRYAASLLNLLGNNNQDTVYALGGEYLQKEGAQLIDNVVSKSSIGFIEPIRHLFYFLKLLGKTKQHLKKYRPDAVLLVDHQGFNVPLAKWCYKQGIPVYSLFAPQYWMWGKKEAAKKFAGYCDQIFCVFDKEFDYYHAIDSNKAVFIGHPLLPELPEKNLKSSEIIIGLFPGSRKQEVTLLCPIMIRSAIKLKESHPKVTFKMAIASSSMVDLIQQELLKLDVEFIKLVTDSRALIAEAYCSIVSSGTVTLEHALIGTPCVSIYKFSPLSFWVAKKLVYPAIVKNCDGFMSLPNILMKRQIMPEFLQQDATVENIYQAMIDYLRHPELVRKTLADFDELRAQLKMEQHPFNLLAKIITMS